MPETINPGENKHPVIAFLTNNTHDPNGSLLWRGIVDTTRKYGGYALCFRGGDPKEIEDYSLENNAAYALVSPERVDGIITWGGVMNSGVSKAQIEDYLKRFAPLPVVNIGLELEGHFNVLADNYQGMWDTVAHLVEVHRRKRIIFIGGPEWHVEATIRRKAYQDALAHYGLPYDPALVFAGEFQPEDARRAIAALLGEPEAAFDPNLHAGGKFDSASIFDAVITNDDGVAAAVIETLPRYGLHAAEDVSVTGFDDTAEADSYFPPLTTARIPNYEMGRLAVETLMQLITANSGDIPARGKNQMVGLPLIVRQSCGCPSIRAQNAAAQLTPDMPIQPLRLLAVQLPQINRAILSEMALDESYLWCIEHFTGPFTREILARGRTPERSFLKILSEFIQIHLKIGTCVDRLQDLVSIMRREMLPYLIGRTAIWMRAEDLWQQARVLIAESLSRWEAYQRMEQIRLAQSLHDISDSLITTYDLRQLGKLIFPRLPEIGIQGFYLALFEDDGKQPGPSQPEWARLVMAGYQGQQFELPEEGIRFPSRWLVPEGFSLQKEHANWIVESLEFNREKIGFVLFASEAKNTRAYETLRNQLGSAMKSSALHAEVLELSLTDSLTGLANRRAFNLFLTKEIERYNRYQIELSLILIDIDHFKLYNDEFGHIAGDDALIQLGAVLNQVARRHLDVAARIGGDEFAVILSGTGRDEALKTTQLISARIAAQTGFLRSITVSQGIAAPGPNEPNPLMLFEHADQALYKAKNLGRDQIQLWEPAAG